MLGFFLTLLYGVKEHDHRSALHCGSLIDGTLFGTSLLKLFEKLSAKLGMTELTSSEAYHDLYLISAR